MSQSLEERIARLATVLDVESTELLPRPMPVTQRATRRRHRGVLVTAAIVSVLAVVTAAWVLSSRGDHGSSVHTNPVANEPSTTVAPQPDLETVQLSAAEQVDWLTRQHQQDATAHIPGWRIELSAEGVECDYAGLPAVSVSKIGGSASDFPLGEPTSAARIIGECTNGTDATRSAGVDLTGQGTLCKSASTKLVVPPGSVTPTSSVVTEPVVIFTGGACEASGYQSPPEDFVDTIEQQRRTELLLRAVPRLCPTADETRTWVERQIETLPDHWTVSIGRGAACALPWVDWATHLIFA